MGNNNVQGPMPIAHDVSTGHDGVAIDTHARQLPLTYTCGGFGQGPHHQVVVKDHKDKALAQQETYLAQPTNMEVCHSC